MNKNLTQADLDKFIGTEQYYRHGLTGYNYTDGVAYLAEKGGAYWLIDKILIVTKHTPKLAEHAKELNVWMLHVNEDKTALLECGDGNGNSIYKEEIKFTDFPMGKVGLWHTNEVLILPSEY